MLAGQDSGQYYQTPAMMFVSQCLMLAHNVHLHLHFLQQEVMANMIICSVLGRGKYSGEEHLHIAHCTQDKQRSGESKLGWKCPDYSRTLHSGMIKGNKIEKNTVS